MKNGKLIVSMEANRMDFARRLLPALLMLLFAFGFATPTKADPPDRVGRINYISGSVSFERGDLDEWDSATINYPMIAGDHLWTDKISRAELHVGSTAIRLASETEFAFLNLDDQTVQIRLSEGSININLRTLSEDEVFEVDTPNAAVSILRAGEYRIDVDLDGNTYVTTWHGEAEVTSAGSAFPVRSREQATIYGFDSPTYDIVTAPRPDDFDNWASMRDRREEQVVSVRYVSREVIGYEDLDDYGTWRTLPGYGSVWVPAAVSAGWAPYRYGHWLWIEPWGWTWVDDAPWGFAPFHYGRWAYVSGVWYWVPGTVVARPVYAPALVAFVGGSSWSVSLSFGGGGGVAWFPLAPGEVYVPAYRVSETYVRNINVTHVNVTNINVTNINVTNVNYVNRTVPGGVTAVSQTVFTSARPVGAAAVVVPTHVVTAAPVAGMTATIAPHRESLIVRASITAEVKVARPPAIIQTRTVVAKVSPPPPPVPFAARQQALAANQGKPLDETTVAKIRQTAPAAQAAIKANVKPAAPLASTSNGAPTPVLRPARQGLPQAQPASVQGFSQPARHAVAPVNSQPTNKQGQGNQVTVEGQGNAQQPAGQPGVGNNSPGHPQTHPAGAQPNQTAEPTQKAQPAKQALPAQPAKSARPARPQLRHTNPDQAQGQTSNQSTKPQGKQPQPKLRPNAEAKPNGKANLEHTNPPNRPSQPKQNPNSEVRPKGEQKPEHPNQEAKPHEDGQPQQGHEQSHAPSKEEKPQPKQKPHPEEKPEEHRNEHRD